MGVGLLREVVDQLCAQQEWEHCSRLCASLRLLVASTLRQPANSNGFASSASNSMQAHTESQLRTHDEHYVSEITQEELGQLVWNLLHVFTGRQQGMIFCE